MINFSLFNQFEILKMLKFYKKYIQNLRIKHKFQSIIINLKVLE